MKADFLIVRMWVLHQLIMLLVFILLR